MQNIISPRPAAAIDTLVDLAEEERLSRRLDYIYSQVPMNKCRRCADCCFNSPQVHHIEWLNIYEYLRALPKLKQIQLGRSLIEYELLNMTTLKNKCPFLKFTGCMIYNRRPLQCRLFGLYPQEEYTDIVRKCRGENEQLANYYAKVKRLPLPAEVMTYDIDQCENNYDGGGNVVVVAGGERARLNEQIRNLSQQVLPSDLLSPNLISFSNRYAGLYLDDGELEEAKIRSIREFQKNGRSQTVDRLLDKFDWQF